MPLRRLDTIDTIRPCYSSEHEPPMFLYLEAGTYEWTCPACGHKTVFTVAGVTYGYKTSN